VSKGNDDKSLRIELKKPTTPLNLAKDSNDPTVFLALEKTITHLTGRDEPSIPDKLSTLYRWEIDKPLNSLTTILPEAGWIQPILQSEKDIVLRTLALRKQIAGAMNGQNEERIGEWILVDWGKTWKKKGVHKEQLPKYRELAKDEKGEKGPFDGIASWSKWLAFKYPQYHVIYDARVIYSINWLLLNAGARRGFFQFPPGRNTVMALLDYRLLLFRRCLGDEAVIRLLDKDIKGREDGDREKSGFQTQLEQNLFASSEDTYEQYRRLVQRLAKSIHPDDNFGMTKIEMLLFAIADRSIAKEVLQAWCPLVTPPVIGAS
jgi:hypothetical protein